MEGSSAELEMDHGVSQTDTNFSVKLLQNACLLQKFS